MALPREQAYALYILLSVNSASRNKILTDSYEPQAHTPLKKYDHTSFQRALAGILYTVGGVSNPDFTDEQTDNMIASDGTANLTPVAIEKSFKGLGYGMGSCPKGDDEKTLWSLIVNASHPLLTEIGKAKATGGKE